MLSNYSFPKTLKENYIDLDIIGGLQPNTEYALYITCDPTTLTNDCWCGFVIPDFGWSSNSVCYGDNTRYFVLKTNENVNNSKFRIRGNKGVTINHIRLIKLVTNSKYSRIERFLYALYSLDSSDLPTPLSRIEELYKCWVTGEEAPTFEPLSRVEKYLMAILGGYDVNELPNPISRVEVLLYKLATGDDNLDDIESFLSEHEELLAEIIRNRGAGGNIDIEYVLYSLSTEFNTLYNTAEKPVKSAILKGKTLVNGFNNSHFTPISISFDTNTPRTAYVEVNGNINTGVIGVKVYGKYSSVLKLQANAKSTVIHGGLTHVNGIFKFDCGGNTLTTLMFYVSSPDFISGCNELINNIAIFKYQDGMENLDIPYFEGMQSVKMPVLTTTGKNLFDKEKHKLNPNFGATQTYYGTDYIKVKPLTTYTRNNQTSLAFYTNYGDTTLLLSTSLTTFTTTAETNYIRYNVLKTEIDTHQLEEGSVATPYEPYKSNILTVNEDVTLRSNGDVYDELNLLTGRLTQRIDENNEVLAQEVVKTVDLSVVDQDGNNTKLSTFDDLTYVTLSSEGLIPEAELEVATKNEEVLATMSLRMDDISTAQSTLEETSDTQSENVDATMLATTEIYEELL